MCLENQVLEDICVDNMKDRMLDDLEDFCSEEDSDFYVPDSINSINSDSPVTNEEIVEDIKGLFHPHQNTGKKTDFFYHNMLYLK